MKKPLVSLCMIVKNEADDLPRCLLSVKDLVDEIIVVDTGSTDDTASIARKFCAKVYDFVWVDNFSAARNFSLEKATGRWILWLDADEELSAGAAELLRPLLRNAELEGLRITMVNYLGKDIGSNRETYQFLKLFRNRSAYRFVRPIHEQLLGVPTDKIADCPGVACLHYGYLDQAVRRKKKGARNTAILEKEIQGESDNFSWFNLGLEYMRQERWQDGVRCLERAMINLPPAIVWGPKLFKAIVTCYLQLGQPEQGIKVCQQGRLLYPDYPDLCYLHGLALKEAGKHAAAVGLLQQCMVMADEDNQQMKEESYQGFRAMLALAQCYLALGRVALAKDYYLKAFAAEAGHAGILAEMLGALKGCLAAKELVEAVETALTKHAGRTPSVVVSLLLSAGLFQEGLDYLAELNLAELNEELHLLKGFCHIMLAQWTEARQEIDCVSEPGPVHHVLSWVEQGTTGNFASREECLQTASILWKAAIGWLERAMEQYDSVQVKGLLDRLGKEVSIFDG